MKRLLSTAFAVFLLLGLAFLAVLARPNGAPSAITGPEESVVAASMDATAGQPEAAPAAGTPKYSNIAMPLSNTLQFTGSGLTYDAKGLALYIGKSAVDQLLRWNPGIQNWEQWSPNSGFGGNGSGTNFALALNGVYFVKANSGLTQTVLSFVGDVPAAGSVHYTMVGGTPCKWNSLALPLDKSDVITNAKSLAASIGKPTVTQELRWNASVQNWESYLPNSGFGGNGAGTNFTTTIGYPYWVCLTQGTTWP